MCKALMVMLGMMCRVLLCEACAASGVLVVVGVVVAARVEQLNRGAGAGNHIGAEGASKLADMLENNTALTSLNLEGEARVCVCERLLWCEAAVVRAGCCGGVRLVM